MLSFPLSKATEKHFFFHLKRLSPFPKSKLISFPFSPNNPVHLGLALHRMLLRSLLPEVKGPGSASRLIPASA
ncbi:hypothetical protein V6Z11_D07G140800 [Gossypium hirsutum]